LQLIVIAAAVVAAKRSDSARDYLGAYRRRRWRPLCLQSLRAAMIS
jgi:hypothetical protein